MAMDWRLRRVGLGGLHASAPDFGPSCGCRGGYAKLIAKLIANEFLHVMSFGIRAGTSELAVNSVRVRKVQCYTCLLGVPNAIT